MTMTDPIHIRVVLPPPPDPDRFVAETLALLREIKRKRGGRAP